MERARREQNRLGLLQSVPLAMTTAVGNTRRTQARNRGAFAIVVLVLGLFSAILMFERSPETVAPTDTPSQLPLEMPASAPPEPSKSSVPSASPRKVEDVRAPSSPPSAALAIQTSAPSTTISAAPAQRQIVLSIDEIFETRETTTREPQAERAELRMRELFEHENVAGAVRDIICRQTVCRLELEWSEAITGPYNEALVKITQEFTNEMSILPKIDGAPTTTVTVYVRYKPAG